MKYIIEMPDKWDGQACGSCCDCPLLKTVRRMSRDRRAECPLANAVKAVEVSGGIARAIGAQFGNPVKLYAVEEGK